MPIHDTEQNNAAASRAFRTAGSFEEEALRKPVAQPKNPAPPSPARQPDQAVPAPRGAVPPVPGPQNAIPPFPGPQAAAPAYAAPAVPTYAAPAAAPMPPAAAAPAARRKGSLWLWIALGFFALAIAGLIYWVVTSGALSEVRSGRKRSRQQDKDDESVSQVLDEEEENAPLVPGLVDGEDEENASPDPGSPVQGDDDDFSNRGGIQSEKPDGND